MAKTHLNSRSGNSVAILLVLGLLFTLVESNGFAQNINKAAQAKIGDSTTLAVSPAAALNEKLAALRAKLQAFAKAETPASAEENAVEASEALKAGAPVAPSPAPKMVSTVLLESLESTLQKMQATASQELPATSAEQAIFYINEKLEMLDRMIYLMEQRQAMQAAAGGYQQRLDAMQKKIEERDARARAGKLEAVATISQNQ